MANAYHEFEDHEQPDEIYIYETPMRIWHWLNALMVVTLTLTGILIGTPLPSYSGDPSTVYVMGWIRLVHLVSAYGFTVLWILRVWWAFVGNVYAHQIFVPPFWSRRWCAGVLHQLRWTVTMTGEAKRYDGVSPLGQALIPFIYILPSLVLLVTGFGMLAEVAGHDSWQYHAFGWMRAVAVNTIDLHTYHRAAMWVMAMFAVMHVYAAVRDDVLSRQSVVSVMLSGYRFFKKVRR